MKIKQEAKREQKNLNTIIQVMHGRVKDKVETTKRDDCKRVQAILMDILFIKMLSFTTLT